MPDLCVCVSDWCIHKADLCIFYIIGSFNIYNLDIHYKYFLLFMVYAFTIVISHLVIISPKLYLDLSPSKGSF